jgi:hypothetical protein
MNLEEKIGVWRNERAQPDRSESLITGNLELFLLADCHLKSECKFCNSINAYLQDFALKARNDLLLTDDELERLLVIVGTGQSFSLVVQQDVVASNSIAAFWKSLAIA